jgi:hypothetical protein
MRESLLTACFSHVLSEKGALNIIRLQSFFGPTPHVLQAFAAFTTNTLRTVNSLSWTAIAFFI